MPQSQANISCETTKFTFIVVTLCSAFAEERVLDETLPSFSRIPWEGIKACLLRHADRHNRREGSRTETVIRCSTTGRFFVVVDGCLLPIINPKINSINTQTLLQR